MRPCMRTCLGLKICLLSKVRVFNLAGLRAGFSLTSRGRVKILAVHTTSMSAIGIEDGHVVRSKSGSLYMVATEMYGEPRWVRTRLAVWRSDVEKR